MKETLAGLAAAFVFSALIVGTAYPAEAPQPPTTKELELTKMLYESRMENLARALRDVNEELEKRKAAEKKEQPK